MARDEERPRRIRAALSAALLIAALALLLTQCPANRDGMPGQLAKAMEETVAAARSGAYALDLRIRDRTTPQVVSVQIADAREQMVKAYEGIADLKADDPVDLDRQRMLTEAITHVAGQLGSASARVREITAAPDLAELRDQLRASADALEAGYR